jgi:hypothetical protein
MTDTWQTRIDAVWADDALDDDARITRIDALAAERPEGDALALYERGGARDSAGYEAEAEVLYRQAFAAGLTGTTRRRAVIQLASTLRNLGRVDESLAMLRAEYEAPQGDRFDDAVAAFYAFALTSAGEPELAASIALETLAPHLPAYNRSVRGYARALRGIED